jgi:hypothetical protein
MMVECKFALGLLLVGALTCVAVSAPPQSNPYRSPGQGGFFANPLVVQQNTDAQSNAYQLQTQSSQLARQYVEAKKEDEKREIRKNLMGVLNHQFDLQIQQQQRELEDLEKQIAKLKEVVRKRLDAKSTIVERRLDQLLHDAEGLGWNVPSGGHAAYQNSFVPLMTAPLASLVDLELSGGLRELTPPARQRS